MYVYIYIHTYIHLFILSEARGIRSLTFKLPTARQVSVGHAAHNLQHSEGNAEAEGSGV